MSGNSSEERKGDSSSFDSSSQTDLFDQLFKPRGFCTPFFETHLRRLLEERFGLILFAKLTG
jgi:hypothetical protein